MEKVKNDQWVRNRRNVTKLSEVRVSFTSEKSFFAYIRSTLIFGENAPEVVTSSAKKGTFHDPRKCEKITIIWLYYQRIDEGQYARLFLVVVNLDFD